MKFLFSLHPNIQIRLFSTFFARLCGGMIFPFMAIYFSDQVGKALAGVLILINVLVGILLGFYGGYIADTVERRKSLVIGQLMNVISFFFMGVANSPWLDSVWLTFTMFLVNSIASSVMAPAQDAMLIDVSTEETRPLIYSIQYWSVNASFMLASIVGPFMFEKHRFLLFIILTSIHLIIFIITYKYISETFVPIKQTAKVSVLKEAFLSYRNVFVDKAFILFCLSGVLIQALENQRSNYIAIHIKESFEGFSIWAKHISGLNMVGIMGVENSLIIVIFTIAVATWVRSKNMQRLMYLGILLQTLGFAFVGVVSSFWFLLLFGLVQTIGEMVFVPIRQTLQAEMMDENARGSYSAMASLVFQFSKMLGALGVTASAYIGSSGMFIAMLIAGIGCAVLFNVSMKKFEERRHISKTI